MSIARLFASAGLAAGVFAAGLGGPASAAPSRGALARSDCFFSSDWKDSKPGSPETLYLRVGMRDIYRVDMRGSGVERLNQPGVFLTSHIRGSGLICAPIDLDLKVADTMGFSMPLFPVAITRLTPAEAAALPKEVRP